MTLKQTFFTLLLIPVSSFADSEGINVEILDKTSRSWDGTHLPAYRAGTPEVSIAKIIIAPGTIVPFHKHPMINVGYLLKGQLTITSEHGDEFRLETGETLVEVVNEWHYGENKGDEPVELIVFYAGIVGDELSIKK